jgi:small subunit ribosomal protein S20
MATHKNAEKAHQQSLVRRQRNRHRRSTLRSALKKLRTAVAEGDLEAARTLLPQALSLLDRTARTRAIHPGTADRQKSRLTRLVSRASAR